jgi:uncharacterized OB-fold protein
MTMGAPLAKSPDESLFRIVTDRWTEPFWAAAKEHRLTVPRCTTCGTFRMPPTPFCPECLSQGLDWPTLSGRGAIYSYTTVTRAIFPEMESSIPYVPALVELPDAGNLRLITNIVGVPIDQITVGAAVEVVWEDRSDGASVPRFTLV